MDRLFAFPRKFERSGGEEGGGRASRERAGVIRMGCESDRLKPLEPKPNVGPSYQKLALLTPPKNPINILHQIFYVGKMGFVFKMFPW